MDHPPEPEPPPQLAEGVYSHQSTCQHVEQEQEWGTLPSPSFSPSPSLPDDSHSASNTTSAAPKPLTKPLGLYSRNAFDHTIDTTPPIVPPDLEHDIFTNFFSNPPIFNEDILFSLGFEDDNYGVQHNLAVLEDHDKLVPDATDDTKAKNCAGNTAAPYEPPPYHHHLPHPVMPPDRRHATLSDCVKRSPPLSQSGPFEGSSDHKSDFNAEDDQMVYLTLKIPDGGVVCTDYRISKINGYKPGDEIKISPICCPDGDSPLAIVYDVIAVSPSPASTLPASTIPASTLPVSTLPASTIPASTLPATAAHPRPSALTATTILHPPPPTPAVNARLARPDHCAAVVPKLRPLSPSPLLHRHQSPTQHPKTQARQESRRQGRRKSSSQDPDQQAQHRPIHQRQERLQCTAQGGPQGRAHDHFG